MTAKEVSIYNNYPLQYTARIIVHDDGSIVVEEDVLGPLTETPRTTSRIRRSIVQDVIVGSMAVDPASLPSPIRALGEVREGNYVFQRGSQVLEKIPLSRGCTTRWTRLEELVAEQKGGKQQ